MTFTQAITTLFVCAGYASAQTALAPTCGQVIYTANTSYVLTADTPACTGPWALAVAAVGVTIDGGGHTLTCDNSAGQLNACLWMYGATGFRFFNGNIKIVNHNAHVNLAFFAYAAVNGVLGPNVTIDGGPSMWRGSGGTGGLYAWIYGVTAHQPVDINDGDNYAIIGSTIEAGKSGGYYQTNIQQNWWYYALSFDAQVNNVVMQDTTVDGKWSRLTGASLTVADGADDAILFWRGGTNVSLNRVTLRNAFDACFEWLNHLQGKIANTTCEGANLNGFGAYYSTSADLEMDHVTVTGIVCPTCNNASTFMTLRAGPTAGQPQIPAYQLNVNIHDSKYIPVAGHQNEFILNLYPDQLTAANSLGGTIRLANNNFGAAPQLMELISAPGGTVVDGGGNLGNVTIYPPPQTIVFH